MVVIGGRTEQWHGDGRRRQRPPGQFVPVASFFNCLEVRLLGIRTNEGRPCLQMWREVRVYFSLIPSVRYRSDGLYCKMTCVPSSPTWFFIREEI